MTTCKKWYQSKTIWLNLSTFFAGLTPLVGNFYGLVDPMTYAIVLTSIGVINVALRVVTTEGVEK